MFVFREHGTSERGISDLHAVLSCTGIIVCTNWRIDKSSQLTIHRHITYIFFCHARTASRPLHTVHVQYSSDEQCEGLGTWRLDLHACMHNLNLIMLLHKASMHIKNLKQLIPELHETSTIAPTAMVCCRSPPKCCCSAAYL